MKTLNVGVLGTGFMGKTHIFAYKTIPLYYDNLNFKINLYAVCSKHIENAKKAKDLFGFYYATDSIYDIINDENVDIIDICTPNIYHKEAVIAALKAGKNVYCDKPLCTSYEGAKEILDAESKTDTINQITFQNRFFPATLLAKKMIDEGKIGKILTFDAKFLHSGSVDKEKPIGWKQDEKISGGGVLFDLGSHILDLLYYLTGEFKSVYAKTQILYGKRPQKDGTLIDITAEDSAFLMLESKNGALGNVMISKAATGENDALSFAIYGDRGAIKFNLMEPNWLYFFDNTKSEGDFGGERGFTKIECVQRYSYPGGMFPSSKSSIGWIRGHVHCMYNFLDSVSAHKKASPSFKEGAYIQYVMEKCYESARENKQIMF